MQLAAKMNACTELHPARPLLRISVPHFPHGSNGAQQKGRLLLSLWTWRDTSRPCLTDARPTKTSSHRQATPIWSSFLACSMIEEYSGPCHSTVQHTTMAPLDSKLLCFTDLPCKSHLLRLLVYPKSPHPQSCYCEKASRNTCSIIQSESDMAKFQISCNYMSCQWMGCDCEELHCLFLSPRGEQNHGGGKQPTISSDQTSQLRTAFPHSCKWV
jgi:hypothetical protein